MARSDEDAAWMRRAIAVAQRSQAAPGTAPVGCVMVRDGVAIGL